MEPAKLTRLIRGELDWIVMRTLEKDRNRRYETASGFAADVQRYLGDQPVEACPPSATYRLRKFARRNRTLLLTGCLVVLALVVGTVVSTWQAFEATSARNLADERLENERRALTDANEQRLQASENLRQALNAVDQMLIRVGDERLAAILGTDPFRRELFRDALGFYEEFFRHAPDTPQFRISIAKAWSRVAVLHDYFGDHTKAQDARRESIQKWEALHRDKPDDAQLQEALASMYSEFGNCDHFIRWRFASAGPALEKAITLWQDLARRFPDNLDYQWNAAAGEVNLGDNYKCEQRFEHAERALRHAVDVQRQLWSRESVSSERQAILCFALVHLGTLLESLKKDGDEAERLYAEAVRRGEDVVTSNPQSLGAASTLVLGARQFGDFLNGRGRLDEAEKHYRRAVDVGQQLLQDDSRNLITVSPLPRAQVALANLLARDGRHLEALSLYRAASELMRPVTTFPEQNGHWADICRVADQGILSTLDELARRGHRDEARKVCEELSQTIGSGSKAPSIAILAAMAWHRIGEVERSNRLLHEAVQRVESEGATNQAVLGSRYAKAFNNLAWNLATCSDLKLRNPAGALLSARKATDLEPTAGVCWNTLGVAHCRNDDWKAAVAALDKSMELRNGGDSFDWFFLAMARWQLHEKEDAREWYDKAVEWMDKNQTQDEELRRFRVEAAALLGVNDKQD